MKIRTENELIDFLSEAKKRRKRELIALAKEFSGGSTMPFRRRAAIVFAYAHWEGFVKDAASAYVEFVSQKSRKLSDLAVSFQALVCRQEFMAAKEAKHRISHHILLVQRLTDRINESCRISADRAIDTESNLTAPVFKNICTSIGVDYTSKWATHGPFINDLFTNRCAIAHGELLDPDDNYAVEVLDFAVQAIDRFSSDIEDAAVQKLFLRRTGSIST